MKDLRRLFRLLVAPLLVMGVGLSAGLWTARGLAPEVSTRESTPIPSVERPTESAAHAYRDPGVWLD